MKYLYLVERFGKFEYYSYIVPNTIYENIK